MMTAVCPLCADDMTPCYITADNGHLTACHGMDKDWIGSSVNTSPIRPHVCAGCGYIALFAMNPEAFRHEANRNRGSLPIPISQRTLPPIDPALPLSSKVESLPPGEDELDQPELSLLPPHDGS